MIISVNWLKKYTNIDLSIDELVKLIGSRLVEIESITDLSKKYKKATIVDVIKCDKLEKSDHLHVLKIDDGGVTPDLERDDDGLIQVVCGAPNIESGQKVVWLPPKSVVPSTFGSKDELILDSRKLMGVLSHGMVASAKELDLYDDHAGIIVVDNDIKPGTSFCSAYEFDDYLLDIENKSLTHRPDCFGIVGFAREVAAIQGNKFITPDWLCELPILDDNTSSNNKISITIDDPNLCPRYEMAIMNNIDSNRMSPLWMQFYLARVGVRPINLIVDITNYLMLVTGQPLHAYDFDKLKTNNSELDIHIRSANDDETIDLIDGKKIVLQHGDIVVASGAKPVALAGAMGGSETAINSETKNIVIESASFNLYNLRGTQMKHGIFSEAITRFTKGQPAGLTHFVLNEVCGLLKKYSVSASNGGFSESYPVRRDDIKITTDIEHVNNVLGTSLSRSEAIDILNNADFVVDAAIDDVAFSVTVPYWRNDIEIREDIDEEIGRIYGFDNIGLSLPWRRFKAVNLLPMNALKNFISHTLSSAGANELLTYSFVHGDLLKEVNQNYANSYKIINSISPDLQYYRQSLLPSLLNLVNSNIRSGYSTLAIFEINKTHQKKHGLNNENVPLERNSIGFVFADKESKEIAFYRVKRYLDLLLKKLNVKASFDKLLNDEQTESGMMDSNRSAAIYVDKQEIGVIGEFKNRVRQNMKLPDASAGFEINLDALLNVENNFTNSLYSPISKYPSIERDICFSTQSMSYQSLFGYINSVVDELNDYKVSVSPLDLYKDQNEQSRNITFRLTFTSMDRTLTNDEINNVIDNIEKNISNNIDAKII
jgi:phenylalanyl-tRNA synthetase beta chain